MEIILVLLHFLTLLCCFLVAFFLVYGIWETFLKKLFSEAKELEERSTLKALRRVILKRLSGFNRKLLWPKYTNRTNRRILSAGGLDNLSAEEFMSAQEVSSLAFVLFGLLLVYFLRKDIGIQVSYFWLVAFLLGGWLVPESWLRDQVKKRHRKILQVLPYNLDLLTLAVEAGLDFQAAVATVVQKGKGGPLNEELSIMLKHLRMGKTREEALHQMADRVNLPQLSSFTSTLIQADRMGTSLGKVLRIQSSQLRIERTQRAEKLANEAPVKMLFPLIFCIFPTVFMVLFGPILFQLLTGKFQ